MKEFIDKFTELFDKKKALEEELKGVKADILKADEKLQNAFAQNGLANVKTDDGRTLYLHRIVRASVPNDPGTMTKFKENGLEAFVKESVNANTLSAWVRELKEDVDGMPVLPEWMKEDIKVAECISMRLRKS